MNGAKIEFAPGLNGIIGARGTGKTTVLEFIRFALDAMPDDAAACKRIEGLVNRNLDGRVELGIETKDGLAYVVSRTLDEDSVVLSEDGKPTEITLKAGGFFKADIFSQNEVESIAGRSLSQLELIDNFEAVRIEELNARGCVEIQKAIAGLADELGALQSLEAKLKEFKVTAGWLLNRSMENAAALDLVEGGDEWHLLFDLAAAEHGMPPADLMCNKERIAALPAFFCTLRGRSPHRKNNQAETWSQTHCPLFSDEVDWILPGEKVCCQDEIFASGSSLQETAKVSSETPLPFK